MWMMPCCLGGVNATQFRFFMKWEIIFFERFLFHFRKIWKIMPLKSTIFLSGRKYIYHGTHLVVIFFVFVVIMNSTLIQIKEKNSGKKFITIIYRVMIWSREKKKVKIFFLFLCIMPLGGNIFVTIVNIGSSIDWRKNVAIGLGFFYSILLKYFSDPWKFFFWDKFFLSLLIKATEGIFLVMVYSSSLMIPSFIHVKKSDKTQGDIDWGYWKTKIIKEGCWLLLFGNWAKLSKLSVQTNTM